MKYEIHFPTEQFGFILKHFEGNDHEVVAEYRSLRAAWEGGEGVSPKEFNLFIDRYLEGNLNGLGEMYERMSTYQQEVVQCIKRSMKRIKSKQSNFPDENEELENIQRHRDWNEHKEQEDELKNNS